MNWKTKFFVLVLVSIPAFVGYPVVGYDSEIVSGLTFGWAAYFFLANLIILAIHGGRFYANVLAVAALVSIPVVFVGGTISYLISLSGLGYAAGQSAYSPHYLSICVTMLTVIPLALSMMGAIPFQRFEQGLLQNSAGVSKFEKGILMFLRVFNHIVFFVIPNILETVREEGQYRKWIQHQGPESLKVSSTSKASMLKTRISALITDMVQLAVESICASIQYIPLWAVEISQLPDKKRKT